MLFNRNHAISSPPLTLVPYSPHHVNQYHKWMQDEELRTLTASDLLSLDEEYANQASWRTDSDKLTFISVVLPEFDGNEVKEGEEDVEGCMLGDINLFLRSDDESASSEVVDLVGEVSIMIAVPEARRKGYGRVILDAFLGYVAENREGIVKAYADERFNGKECRLVGLSAKIDQENGASIKLFEKAGFEVVGAGANYFGEVELRRSMESVGTRRVAIVRYE